MKDLQRRMPAGDPRTSAAVSGELDIASLPTSGRVPRELCGTLLCNGLTLCASPDAACWRAGDGMLHALRFDQGRVSYRNRCIHTPRRCSPCAATPGAAAGSTANTHLIFHAGQLLALDQAQLPLRIDGRAKGQTTGQTKGQTKGLAFAASLSGAFTAHPKVDPTTGEMIFFGCGTPDRWTDGMVYGSLDACGQVARFERFRAPYASSVHDFAFTRRHVLLPVVPLAASAERAAAGCSPLAWEPSRGAYLGLLLRDRGVGSIEWRTAPTCYVSHVMNAWDDGRRVQLDVMQADVPARVAGPDGSAIEGDSKAYLTRWTVDLDAGAPCRSQEFICDIPGEFPRIDDRFAGAAHRHAWFVGDGAHGQAFACLVHIDHYEGRLDLHPLPDGDCASEGVFVPRSARAGEGVGWLLTVVYRGRSGTSDLLVFNARQLCAGPVACVRLPCGMPNGSHGHWVDATTGWDIDG